MSRLVGYWDRTETLASRTQEEERDHGSYALEGCRFSLTPLVLSQGSCEEVSSSLCHIFSTMLFCLTPQPTARKRCNHELKSLKLWDSTFAPLSWLLFKAVSQRCSSNTKSRTFAYTHSTRFLLFPLGCLKPLSGKTLGSNSVHVSRCGYILYAPM